jgi:hypothetical protein
MNTEILERDRSDASKLSNTERGQVARSNVVDEHYGSLAFAWGLIGALGVVLAATILTVLFF